MNRQNLREKYPIGPFEEQLERILKGIPKQKPLILIQGGYGKNNTGDDALLLAIRQKVLEIVPGAHIVALCHGPENVQKLYGIEAAYFTDKKARKLLRTCDALIIGGGGIVNKINTYSGLKVFKIFDPKGKFLFFTALFTKLRKKPVVFYVVGMTSIPDALVRFLMKCTLGWVDLLAVRDPVSYQIAGEIAPRQQIFLCHDPALNYRPAVPANIQPVLEQAGVQEGQEYIVLNARFVLDEAVNAGARAAIAAVIAALSRQMPEKKIILLPISMHPSKRMEDDLQCLREIQAAAEKQGGSSHLLKRYLHPAETQALLAGCSALVMTRLHGLILSFDDTVPTVVLAYEHKVEEFAKMAGYAHILDYSTLTAGQLAGAVGDCLGRELHV